MLTLLFKYAVALLFGVGCAWWRADSDWPAYATTLAGIGYAVLFFMLLNEVDKELSGARR